ncbi:uncharacterized protein LOC144109413 isoform X3 [Amblyomma americanum]
MRTTRPVCLVLLLGRATILAYEEKDFKCWDKSSVVATTSVCDGVLDCLTPHGSDESPEICEPEAPVQVSVLSARQRTAVLNIVGPTAWNSDPVGFHVLWEAVGDSNGQRGGLEVQLPADWSPEENTINATLSLQGGGDYRLSVSAVGTDGAGAVLRGPGVEIETRMPFDSYEISAYPVDSSRAIISWLSPDAASLFLLTLYADVAEDDGRNYTVRQFDGTGKVNSRHSVVISSLQPWTYYVASIKGCLAENCSLPVNTTFVTPPLHFPRPVITRAESTSNISVILFWDFPQHDPRLYEGFRVRCCLNGVATCSLFWTKSNNIVMRGVDPDTTVAMEVRAKFTDAGGRPLLGPPATATVTTWSKWPKITVEHGANMQSKDGTSLLRWTCVNGTVDYLQYSTTEAEEWSTCNNSAICDVTVDHGHTATLTTGFLRLTHGVTEGILMVWVRGCNSYGCGHESSVSVNLLYAGPSALTSLSITPFDRTGIIRWYASSLGRHDGIEITWKCNDKTKLVYHRRIWQEFRYGTEAHIEDWSRGVENCKFNVSAYMDDKDGTTHYSPPIEATPESS